ncbi:MAG TPA: cation-translocating P-type ATPase [Candidatus Tectomicrobia bacterium]|nr:cation-translocating P-type ATPase [Candidatus Tectomicrobia bacterium]
MEKMQLTLEGICCADEAAQVESALKKLDGILEAHASVVAGAVTIVYDPTQLDLTSDKLSVVREAVRHAGCAVSMPVGHVLPEGQARLHGMDDFTRHILTIFGIAFGAVLFVVVVGEWLGFFEAFSTHVPWILGVTCVLVGGFPVFRNVLRASWRGHITSHTLMTVGVMAALGVGEWTAAAVVVFFMRIGDYAERFTTERARRAVKDLTTMAPARARIERDGAEYELPAGEVRIGDIVVVRPGEKIPVDGEVISGHATLDQASITGESMPVDAGPGAQVFAATFARLGSVRIRTTHVGPDTTFGRVVRMVEEAETHRAEVQRLADRFSAYYLPVVASIAALTLLLRQDPLATAAVLVVACSCAFALATPMAMLASIGAAARRGLLIKGGKYLESLAHADVLLIDKTGTLTFGRPHITDIVPLNGASEEEVLRLAASAERYSEHPMAEAIRHAARQRRLSVHEPHAFQAVPGMGVQAQVNGSVVAVGNRRMIPIVRPLPGVEDLEARGKTLLYVARDGEAIGVLAAADTLRPEVPMAIAAVRELDVRHIELLTGDQDRAAAALAEHLGVCCRANLLPEEKIAIVKEYQSKGHTVIMVGDGVNDAPALAQADVGIAMGAAGSDVAIEAAHIALMRDDWALVPLVLRVARRTMTIVKLNIAFTAIYNLAGLALASLGVLPLIFAAAAQSLPDLGILANSSRLLWQEKLRKK